MAAIRDSLKTRIKRLEAAHEDVAEPMIIFLSVTDGHSKTLRQAVISGIPGGNTGDWLHRNEGESEHEFTERAQARCRELHGTVVEIDVD